MNKDMKWDQVNLHLMNSTASILNNLTDIACYVDGRLALSHHM